MALFRVLAVLLATCLAQGAAAQVVGQAVEVAQAVQVIRGGVTATLGQGGEVAQGDVIVTGPTGRAQLVFVDETRIAVGPNARLSLDAILFKRNNTARQFAIGAAGGSLRFLTGNSPKRAYKLRTPSTTMGVRGTIFDVTVADADTTRLVVFEGNVSFCGQGKPCATVRGGCQTLSFSRSQGYQQPGSVAEKQDFLASNFPLYRNQRPLRRDYVVSANGCGRDDRVSIPRDRVERGGDRDGGGGGGGGGNPAQ